MLHSPSFAPIAAGLTRASAFWLRALLAAQEPKDGGAIVNRLEQESCSNVASTESQAAEGRMGDFFERFAIRAATLDELFSDAFEVSPGQKADADVAARRLALPCTRK